MSDELAPATVVELAQRIIANIADAANNIAFQAGVGGCETAGAIVSYLGAHPEKVETFFRDGWISALGDDHDPWADGCLTFQSINGEITTPEKLRASKAAKREGKNP